MNLFAQCRVFFSFRARCDELDNGRTFYNVLRSCKRILWGSRRYAKLVKKYKLLKLTDPGDPYENYFHRRIFISVTIKRTKFSF